MSEKPLCKHEGCETRPRTGEYCSRHRPRTPKPKAVVEKLEEVNKPRKAQKKVCESTFLITISSNKSGENADDVDILSNLNEYLFGVEAHIADFLIDIAGNELDILSVQCHPGAIELSERYKRIHFHSALECKHNNMLRVDKKSLQSFCKQALGVNCYINIRVPEADDIKRWKSYSLKTV